MTTIHSTASFNAIASLNAWMDAGLKALTRPAWLPSIRIVYNRPEVATTLPAFSIAHFDAGSRNIAQGRNVGGGLRGVRNDAVMEIGCWVSRGDSRWIPQLRTMVDMVGDVFVPASQGVLIQDYASNLASPSDTTFRVTLANMTVDIPAPDPNPDIEWRRVLIEYMWIRRSSN